MMSTVKTLTDLCLDHLADNSEILCRVSRGRGSTHVWRHPGPVLPGELAEKLMYKLSERGKLNDSTLCLFQREHVCLRHVEIPDARYVTRLGLEMLRYHPLSSLSICHGCLSSYDIKRCFGSQNWGHQSLRHSHVKYSNSSRPYRHRSSRPYPEPHFDRSDRFFPRFNSISYLCLVDLGLSDKSLNVIAWNISKLKLLDISENPQITDISALQDYQSWLETLIMHDMPKLTKVTTVRTLRWLRCLKSLDVSLYFKHEHLDCFVSSSLLMDPSDNPNLESLDLSGRVPMSQQMLGTYLDAHQSLSFLGLWRNDSCGYSMFDAESPQQYRPNIKVSGDNDLAQYATALKQYLLRDHMIRDVLQKLTDELSCDINVRLTTDNDDIIKAILKVMPAELSLNNSRFSGTAHAVCRAEMCLRCLLKLLRNRHVSNIESNTIAQLLGTCHQVLNQLQGISHTQQNSSEVSLDSCARRGAEHNHLISSYISCWGPAAEIIRLLQNS